MKDTKKGIAEQSEMGLSLEELIRRAARELIQKAIEVEVQELLAEYGNVKMLGGQRAVVRNGYLPAREVLTAIGNVEVRVPKVRDRSGGGIKFNSALVPPFVRRSQRVSAALPWLYLKGISTGDMREALTVLLGDEAKGLSANVVSRLKSEWATEYSGWMKRDLSASRYVYWWVDGIHTGLRQEERRPAMPAGHHRCDAGRQERAGHDRRRATRIEGILARRLARSGRARLGRRPFACRGRRRVGVLGCARRSIS